MKNSFAYLMLMVLLTQFKGHKQTTNHIDIEEFSYQNDNSSNYKNNSSNQGKCKLQLYFQYAFHFTRQNDNH